MERTTNLSLKMPGLDDDALISDLNDNARTLDSKIGPVGNVSLQSQITAQSDNIAKIRYGLSYVEDGTTIAANAAYTAGKFICWQGEMYRIKATINATVTSGNWTTYLDKMDGMGGALSQINADLTSLNDRLTEKTNVRTIDVTSYSYNSAAAYAELLSKLPESWHGNVYARFGSGFNAMCMVVKTAGEYASIMAIFDYDVAPKVYTKSNISAALKNISTT